MMLVILQDLASYVLSTNTIEEASRIFTEVTKIRKCIELNIVI